MRKFLKITGIVLGLLLLLLFLTPFIFKGQIKDLVLKTINEAAVEFGENVRSRFNRKGEW